MALEDEEAQDALDAADAKDDAGGGFNPAAYVAATAGPRRAAQRHAGFDPAAYVAATQPAAPAAPAEEPGVGESLARGAAQGATFGFADELTGALKAAFTDESYSSARDKSREAYAAAQAAHPVAYGGAELAGGIAPMLIPGGAIGKAVGLGAKAVEGGEALAAGAEAVQGATKVSKAAQLAADAAKSTAAVTGDLKAGAAFGAASALGNTESGYQSSKGGWGQAFRDVAEGAATGGALQAGLGKVGRTLTEGAVGRATKDLMEVVRGSAPAKFAKKVAADADDIEATLFRPENRNILQHLGNAEKVIPLTEARMETVGTELDTLKTELDDELSTTVFRADTSLDRHGGAGLARPGKVTRTGGGEPPAGELAGAGEHPQLGAPEEGALARRDQLTERPGTEYTPPVGEVGYRPPPTTVEGRAVPKTIDLQPEEVAGGAKLGDIVTPLESRLSALERQPGNGAEKRALRKMLSDVKDSWSPGKYDPGTIVSTRDLRAYVTQTQKDASNTIGTINESLASELKHDLSATVTKIMNAHLDRAAAASPRAAEIVAKMRDLNTQYSAFANMIDAFRGSAWKEMVKSKSASKIIGEGAQHAGLTAAAVAAGTGHPIAAAAALTVPIVKKLIDKGAVAGNRWLATVYRAAAAGSTKDQLIKLAVDQGAPAAIARYVAGRLAS